MKNFYQFLLSTPLSEKWKKIGPKRRAGIATPLFFVYTKKSIGIGEIPDLKVLIDWCQKTGNTILELLPLNDTGFNFRPYDAQSSFAIDPIYLSLRDLSQIKKDGLEDELNALAKKFPLDTARVNYDVKGAKLESLWRIFSERASLNSDEFNEFKIKNRYWLEDYSLFRILKEYHQEKSWEKWEEHFKNRDSQWIARFKKNNQRAMEFAQWLQWQLYEQIDSVRRYAKEQGVLLKGDLPLLIARDSADVWSHPQYFDLSYSSGAPPDSFASKGQRWGMPPYNWGEIKKDDFFYIKERLKYAENFYDLFRIDHIVGIFRIWKIPLEEPLKNKGLNGFFDPKDENTWEEHGRQILLQIIENTKMLPCAEDLGTIPLCCPKVLKELGIPGIQIQRWTRNWETSEFKKPEDYRPVAIAILSTHDSPNWLAWWKSRTKKEKDKFLKMVFGEKIILSNQKTFRKELIKKNLETINQASSIFCILLLLEWLFLDDNLRKDLSGYRFNRPGTVSKKNWSLRMPLPLEDLLENPITLEIKKILDMAGRI